jgi:SAM-dependent methyltransferase
METTRTAVREDYAATARTANSSAPAGSCCSGNPDDAEQLARAVGYDAEDLETLPEGANMGLSCGNPVALAALKPGEVVVDLGSGGGFDVFIAGRKVGPAGRAIGVDMTPEMLEKARRNTASYREHSGLDNVEFRLGEIEHLPLADASADVVISNCVINLSPDQPQVWRELARVLKPGGRVAVSDVALLAPLPPAVREVAGAISGCVAGAQLLEDVKRMAHDAGLADVRVTVNHDYADIKTVTRRELYDRVQQALPPGKSLGDYLVSAEVNAVKPGGACCGG